MYLPIGWQQNVSIKLYTYFQQLLLVYHAITLWESINIFEPLNDEFRIYYSNRKYLLIEIITSRQKNAIYSLNSFCVSCGECTMLSS